MRVDLRETKRENRTTQKSFTIYLGNLILQKYRNQGGYADRMGIEIMIPEIWLENLESVHWKGEEIWDVEVNISA
jgi:hypothetical protein